MIVTAGLSHPLSVQFMRAVLVAALLFLGPASFAGAAEIPPEARSREARLLAIASPAVRAWVHEEAGRVRKTGPIDERVVQASVTERFGSTGDLSDLDITAIAFLVLMEATKDMQEDLKAIMKKIKRIEAVKQQPGTPEQRRNTKVNRHSTANTIARPEARAAMPPRIGLDMREPARDLERMQLSLQDTRARHTKAVQAVSNLMKNMNKVPDTESSIISKLK